ncbi:MAG: DUF2291 domain-containing protein [Suipraeoptans sp.]
MKKRVLAVCLSILLASFAVTGCAKVVKIGEEDKYTGKKEFNAGDNVAEIWDAQAIPEFEKKAVDLDEFITESNGDFASLVDKYGKYSMGDSGEINYVVKGSGTITEINTDSQVGFVTVKPDNYDGPVVIKLQIGPVYKGSALRDSLSFIKFGDYTNQQEWAEVSQSINAVIDKNVVKKADVKALQGKSVSFLGAFTQNGNDEILITPVELSEK